VLMRCATQAETALQIFGFKAGVMKTYRVELLNRDRLTLEVAEDRYILEAIESVGLRLPVGCRYGSCITCAAQLVRGEVDQPKAIALKPMQVDQGYVLLCIASPKSDCQFLVGRESQEGLYVNPFRG
jgi:ferredoxin